MTKTEFEELIMDNEHKEDILHLVDEGCTHLINKDESSLERYYEECADLYNKSNGYYQNFKLNMAQRISLHYRLACLEQKDNEMQERQNKIQQLVETVKNYAENNIYGQVYQDKNLIDDIVSVLWNYELVMTGIAERLAEYEDKKHIKEIIDAHDEGKFPLEMAFIFKEGPRSHKVKLESEKAIRLFVNEFVPFFSNRFVEYVKLDELEKTIQELKRVGKKTLPHKAVYDLYMVFVKYEYVDFNKKDVDTYELGDRNGLFASLNGQVSLWIYNLLLELGYFTDRTKKVSQPIYRETEKEQRQRIHGHDKEYKDYIRDCLEDKYCREIDLEKLKARVLDSIL